MIHGSCLLHGRGSPLLNSPSPRCGGALASGAASKRYPTRRTSRIYNTESLDGYLEVFGDFSITSAVLFVSG